MTAVYTDDPHQVVHCADCLELVAEDPQDDNDYLGRCLHCRREITAQGGVQWRRAVPEGEYTSVSAGVYHACGIRIDQTVACWGSNLGFDGDFLGQATPPDGPFEVINAGTFHTCGFRPPADSDPTGRSGAGEALRGGMDGEVTTCEQQPDGTSRCWTDEKATEATRAWGGWPDSPPDGNLKAIDSGQGFSCALWDGGHIVCWGSGGINDPPPLGIFKAVTVGGDHCCGLRPDGSIECWGDDTFAGLYAFQAAQAKESASGWYRATRGS